MDFPIPPEFWWRTDILSSSIFLQGVDQEILPFGQGRIDSAKINPSLLMMREWQMLSFLNTFPRGNIDIHPHVENTDSGHCSSNDIDRHNVKVPRQAKC